MTFFAIVMDLILAAILVAGIIIGIKRGFVKTVAKPVKFFAALIIAFSFCVAFSESAIEPIIQKPITNQLSDYMNDNYEHLSRENVSSELPTVLKMSAALLDVDVVDVASRAEGSVVASIVEELTAPIVHIVGVIVAFIILCIISRIVLSVLLAVANSIMNIGAFGFFNRLLGLVFGFALAVILDWFVVVLVEFICGYTQFDGSFSYIYNLLNKLNPLELLLSF